MKNVYNLEMKHEQGRINFKPIYFDFFQIKKYPRIYSQPDSIDPLKQASFVFCVSC